MIQDIKAVGAADLSRKPTAEFNPRADTVAQPAHSDLSGRPLT